MSETRASAPDHVLQGIVIILASVTAMSFADAVVKWVSSDLTVWQVLATRSMFAVPCLVFLGYRNRVHFSEILTRWIVIRSALLVLTWLAFYASLPVLELSVAAVAVYSNPILTTLLSALVMNETVTRRQWMGVLLGFAGVTAILRPGTDDFSWFLLLPLLAAAFYSSAMVLTRKKCKNDPAINLALGLHGSFIVTGLGVTTILAVANLDPATSSSYAFLLGAWSPMDVHDWSVMAVLGILSAGFFLGVARAYQIAPPQIIGTFDYAYLISAAIWGSVFFAEQPEPATVAGMILITTAGLLVARGGPKR